MSTPRTVVYVANAGSHDISILALEAGGEPLVELQRFACGGVVMPLAVSPDRRVLHASIRSAPFRVVSLAIDGGDGRLRALGEAPLPASMCWISTDRRGRFLLSAAYDASLVAVSPIGADGVALAAQQVVPTEPHAHAMQVDPANRFAFATSLGGDLVRQFRFDADSGRLDDNEPPAWRGRPGAGPRHFVFHPALPVVYLLNELDSSVEVLSYDAAHGRLASLQSVSALPAGSRVDKPWAADLHLRPDGRFLYASERRSSTLAAFAVDPASGRLASIGSVATETEPRGFAISPDGRLLIAVGQASHRLSRYAIDPATGVLDKLGDQPVGQGPNWVEIVDLPGLSPGDSTRVRGPLAVALVGMVALAVAMGIGRFAFTPILPMMLRDGVVDLARASWLASANYIGYLVGALLCAAGPWFATHLPQARMQATARARAGLAATSVLTLAMALPLPAAWPLWRFAAGVASAIVLVYTSGWCLSRLATHGRSALGGLMFAGPGAGIVASGLVASGLVAANARSEVAWLVFGALAVALSATLWTTLRDDAPAPTILTRAASPAEGAETAAAAEATGTAEATVAAGPAGAPVAPAGANVAAPATEIACFALAYGLAGLGYIVTATFLPVIARAALPGSPALDLFWPIFGAGAVAGALLSTRLRAGGDLRLRLAAAYAIQALGIGIGIVSPTEAGLAIGSLLLGMPFTTITFFAMQEARRLRPQRTASTIGLLTATYGIGQIIGPPMVSLLLARSGEAGAGFRLSLEIAAATLLAGAGLYLLMRRLWPAPARSPA